MLDCNDTPRTYKYDDWSHKNGQAVSDDLSKFEYKKIDSSGNMVSRLFNVEEIKRIGDPPLRRQYKKSDTKRLLEYRGTLFIDNLRCKKKDSDDENGYIELALKIDSLSKIPRSQRGWLVFYTRDYSNFPSEFIEQFDPEGLILLEKVKSKKKKQRKHRIPDNKFKQLIKDATTEGLSRRLEDEKVFFYELSKMSKLTKYDKTQKGYTPKTAKKRYYELFPSKKANQ